MRISYLVVAVGGGVSARTVDKPRDVMYRRYLSTLTTKLTPARVAHEPHKIIIIMCINYNTANYE